MDSAELFLLLFADKLIVLIILPPTFFAFYTFRAIRLKAFLLSEAVASYRTKLREILCKGTRL